MIKAKGNLIILALLTLPFLIALYNVAFGEARVNWPFYLGGLFIIVCWILFALNKSKNFRKILGITLIGGTINLLQFSDWMFEMNLSFTPNESEYILGGLNLFLLLMTVFYCYVNSESIFRVIRSATNNSDDDNEKSN